MVDLMGKRYYFFGLSLLFIMLGVISFLRNGGLNYDIQFQGGTIMQFQMEDGEFDPAEAERLLGAEMNQIVTARKLETGLAGTEQEEEVVSFLVVNIAQREALTLEEQNRIIDLIKGEFNVSEEAQVSINMVDASIGRELKVNAGWAVLIAAILIVMYVWWRFSAMSGLSAGVMAVVALLHDIAIMFSVYTIFNLPVNESFVAAILTIIGYSMNDTVIIYDRVRENKNLLKKVSVKELVNRSIIQTLPRTINTTIAVFITIAVVFVFATIHEVQSIREFAFPLMIGIVSGTYSSIFIASPFYVMWKEGSLRRLAASKSK
jgi:preprotein translocase subunit SecF